MGIAEAIQNSLDAISDSGHPGWITVEIQRDHDLVSPSGGARPIRSVVIRDNGIGFNDVNFESFSTPDTQLKVAKGGKGVGRLMWLQAFKQISVDSVYRNGASARRRQFVFQIESPELAAADTESSSTELVTEVRLLDLRDNYSTTSTVTFETITDSLVEHFLPALVEKPAWLKSLTISDGNKRADLTKVVEGGAEWSQEFTIRTYRFRAVCYAISAGEKKTDMVRLVAAGRIVNANTQPIEFFLPHLGTIADEVPHIILVHSPFFDEHVNDARNGVSFDDEADGALLGVTAAEFRTACAEALKKHLGPRLQSSANDFKERVEAVVSREARYYRPLLVGFFDSKEFENLSAHCRDEDILAALDAYKRRDALKLRQESKRLAKLQSQEVGYGESARVLADQIEVQKKVALAEYVSLRKIVLDHLQQLISMSPDGKAHREAAIHDLVFPQRTDTESNPGVDHQLWILDERLESNDYLSSDKPIDGKRGDRPDLLIALDRPGAFASDPPEKSKGYERIVLVEFKQALKDLATVPTDELPHQQMMRYARKINDGEAQHLKSGRPIKPAPDARFYMYAVCELSEAMLMRLEELGFTRTSFGSGAFWVTNKGRYYIQYISLEKLLDDATARNLSFFRRLGLEG